MSNRNFADDGFDYFGTKIEKGHLVLRGRTEELNTTLEERVVAKVENGRVYLAPRKNSQRNGIVGYSGRLIVLGYA